MIITTYVKHSNSWKAVAQFPHANNPYKYHEYDYRGFGKTPQEATNELMAQLEANYFVYDFIYFIPERLTRYQPETYYDVNYNTWCVKMEYRQGDGGDTDIVLVFGDTPHAAFTRLAAAFSPRGVYLPPSQRRTAEDLFTI
jgi:hypothetical protein